MLKQGMSAHDIAGKLEIKMTSAARLITSIRRRSRTSRRTWLLTGCRLPQLEGGAVMHLWPNWDPKALNKIRVYKFVLTGVSLPVVIIGDIHCSRVQKERHRTPRKRFPSTFPPESAAGMTEGPHSLPPHGLGRIGHDLGEVVASSFVIDAVCLSMPSRIPRTTATEIIWSYAELTSCGHRLFQKVFGRLSGLARILYGRK